MILQTSARCAMLPAMRHLLVLVIALLAGCASTPPEAVQQSIQGNLDGLKLLEEQLLPLIDNAAVIDFGQIGGDGPEQLFHARDGWRIILRSYQLRAAGNVAWSLGEKFDDAAGTKALVIPAVEQARANMQPE